MYNHEKQIDAVIEKSGILEKETRLDKYCCRLLVTELLFGQQLLPGESKPVTTVLSYEDEFRRILRELGSDYYVEDVKPGMLIFFFVHFFRFCDSLNFGWDKNGKKEK